MPAATKIKHPTSGETTGILLLYIILFVFCVFMSPEVCCAPPRPHPSSVRRFRHNCDVPLRPWIGMNRRSLPEKQHGRHTAPLHGLSPGLSFLTVTKQSRTHQLPTNAISFWLQLWHVVLSVKYPMRQLKHGWATMWAAACCLEGWHGPEPGLPGTVATRFLDIAPWAGDPLPLHVVISYCLSIKSTERKTVNLISFVCAFINPPLNISSISLYW